jgi:hypothetical protein
MATDLIILSEMLNESAKLKEEKMAQLQVAHLGPGDIGPPRSKEPAQVEKKKDPEGIWDEDEVDEAHLLDFGSEIRQLTKVSRSIAFLTFCHSKGLCVSGRNTMFAIVKRSSATTRWVSFN